MRMRSKPASCSRGFASSHSRPSLRAGVRRARTPSRRRRRRASSAAGVEPSARASLRTVTWFEVARRRSRRARRRRRSPASTACRRSSGSAPGRRNAKLPFDSCTSLPVAVVDLLLEVAARGLRACAGKLWKRSMARRLRDSDTTENQARKANVCMPQPTPLSPEPAPRGCRWTASATPCRRAPCPRSGARRGCSRCAGGAAPARSTARRVRSTISTAWS